ncbi:hypothetical protein [Pseudomonas putida]|uniref:hypothetical protein n=1 Tax=Pseudomonas TaxID=286 RepID=UPI0007B6B68E|nr:hypothetical protein [Pseudomonas putida]ANC03681.1 hypothetical protein AB688_16715 [Pseudomonas putida]KAB5625778.1 hypothetical protein F7234_08315 [Pseudomonas putida]
MSRRNDRSMLLVLSQEEGSALKSIIDLQSVRNRRMSGPRRLVIGIGASLLVALMALGLVRPELAIAIAEWAGLLLAF